MEQVPILRRMVSEAEAEWCRENIAAMEKRIPERGESTDEQYRKAVSTYNTVKNRNPFTQNFVVQLASFEGGTYLATQRGVENKGYSASLFCNVVGPEGGHELVEHTLRMLEEIKE